MTDPCARTTIGYLLVRGGLHAKALEVIQGAMKGVPYPVLEEEPQLSAPGEVDFDTEMFKDIAKKLGLSDEWKQRQG